MLSGEPSNAILIVFGLSDRGLEPKIYRTRGKHAIHCILMRFGSIDVSINDILHQKASNIKITEIDLVTKHLHMLFHMKVTNLTKKVVNSYTQEE